MVDFKIGFTYKSDVEDIKSFAMSKKAYKATDKINRR